MSHRRLSAATVGTGFLVTACSVMMAFFADHHWIIGYNASLFFERILGWVQLAGLLLLVVGSLWVAMTHTPRANVQLGSAFCATALLLPLPFGGYRAILNVHSWTFILVFPVLLLAFTGASLTIVGLARSARQT